MGAHIAENARKTDRALRSGASPSADALRVGINARVEARFQKVADVIIVEQMPRNVAGKPSNTN